MCESEYARLSRDVLKPFSMPGETSNISDEKWRLPVTDIGVVALSDDYSAEKQLPYAQRWPWDSSKSIYLLQGYHNLHCLKKLRKSILQCRDGSNQSELIDHIDHCLVALREDILCNADDSPRYSGGGQGSADGQRRYCRDWAYLDLWTSEHSACYVEPENYDDGLEEIQLYRRCPDGSVPSKATT